LDKYVAALMEARKAKGLSRESALDQASVLPQATALAACNHCPAAWRQASNANALPLTLGAACLRRC
jgi:hypothetical protein